MEAFTKPFDLNSEEIRKIWMFVHTSRDVLYIQNITKQNFEFISDSLISITGYSPEEFKSFGKRRLFKMIHPEDFPGYRKFLLASTEQEEGFENFEELEYRVRHHDGYYVWISEKVSIIRDGDESSGYRVGNVREITDSKRKEIELKHQEHLHRLIVENISEAVFITDPEGRLKYTCPNVNAIFQYPDDRWKKMKTINSFLPELEINYRELVKKEEVHNIKHSIINRKRQRKNLLVSIKRIQYQGNSLLFTCHDISELEMKNNELLSLSFFLEEKNRLMAQVEQSMEEIRKKGYSNCREEIETMLQTMLMSNNPEYDWDIFLKHFKEINRDFYHSLFNLNRSLSQNDLRHCVYIKMNLSTRQIARLLNVKTSSVQMARVRLKKKLKLGRDQNLYDFIQSIG